MVNVENRSHMEAQSETPDLRKFLESWPYDPEHNVRLARGANGREILVVRQPFGLEEYEVDGRPDGQRPHGMESAYGVQLARLAAAKRVGAEDAFKLTTADCAELFDEGTIYYYRVVNLFHLNDWVRAERDTTRNLRMLDFVRRHAEREEDRVQLEEWLPDLKRMKAVARAMSLLEKGKYDEAMRITGESIGNIEVFDEHRRDPRELANALLQELRQSLAIRPALRPHEQSVFSLQGDYWTIIYQGQLARLKATRGLHYLACLLRHPGREFHVSQLIADSADVSVVVWPEGHYRRESGIVVSPALAANSGPILDSRAKAEYWHRLQDLRKEFEESERFGDHERAAIAQAEMNSIAQQLASAIGLGGRDRRIDSEAERCRSAVTKRIKESLTKIGEVIPALGRHLAVRIKTGYFCSYNPHPNRPVAWEF